MDPLTALSVAAAVVQFVDYGTSIVSKSRELYESASGALKENVELEEATLRLNKLTQPLVLDLVLPKNCLSASDTDDSLRKICLSCVRVSNELIGKLEVLKVSEKANRKGWASLRKAFRSVWSKDKIEEIRKRLEGLRTELETHFLVAIRAGVDSVALQQTENFQKIDIMNQQIMLTLLKGHQTLSEQNAQIAALAAQVKATAVSQKEEVDALREKERKRYEKHVQHSLLESLRYNMMKFRQETISEAHRRTFQWVFDDTETAPRPWSDFKNWLQDGNGIYWINGKPGAGKSTLMKYLVDTDETRKLLDIWADGASLEMPCFFFLRGETLDQRSHTGLLRTLLYEILQKNLDLIAHTFSEQWVVWCEVAASDVPVTFNTWTLESLKKAFQRLLGQTSEKLRLCFFIDGLDEFEGDYEEFGRFFSDLQQTTNFKMCISSRPWPVFKALFHGKPQLALQDLTRNDIQQYVETELQGNNRMMPVIKKEPERAQKLINTITTKADGVFLWVKLVVSSLLKGLNNGDGMEILEKRLAVLPADLKALYDHMFKSIDPFYMEDALKIFQLYNAFEHNIQEEVELVRDVELICRALKVDIQEVVEDSAVQAVSFEAMIYEADLILQSRCGGLFETVTTTAMHGLKRAHLSYIHTTASEYLEESRNFGAISGKLPAWNANLALLMACVLSLKASIVEPGSSKTSQVALPVIDYYWQQASYHARATVLKSAADTDAVEIILDKFDDIGICASRPCAQHWSGFFFKRPCFPPTFLSAAIRAGLWTYVDKKLSKDRSSIDIRSSSPLLAHAFMLTTEPSLYHAELVIPILLKHGASPNDIFHGSVGFTVWEYWIHILHSECKRGGDGITDKAKKRRQTISRLMLEHGADPDTFCINNTQIWKVIYESFNHTNAIEKCPAMGLSPTLLWEHSLEVNKPFSYETRETGDAPAEQPHIALVEHSVSTVLQDCFASSKDSDDAKKLLELAETLKRKHTPPPASLIPEKRKVNFICTCGASMQPVTEEVGRLEEQFTTLRLNEDKSPIESGRTPLARPQTSAPQANSKNKKKKNNRKRT